MSTWGMETLDQADLCLLSMKRLRGCVADRVAAGRDAGGDPLGGRDVPKNGNATAAGVARQVVNLRQELLRLKEMM